MRIFLLILFMFFIATTGQAYETWVLGKTNGVTKAKNDIAPRFFADPDVDVISYRFTWEFLQPVGMNWTEWDELEGRITKTSKDVAIRITSGYWTPQWVYQKVYSKGGTTLTLPDRRYGGTYEYIPYWNGSYKWQWKNFIRKIANRVNQYPNLKAVHMSGPTEYSAEMHLPKNDGNKQKLIDAGHTTELLVNTWKELIDHYLSVFRPDINIIINTAIPLGDTEAHDQILEYARANGVYLQGNWLKHNTSNTFHAYSWYLDNGADGFQFARPQSGNLNTAIQKGLDAGATYFEFYQSDL
jgi:hypothetical protein